jgi:protein-tyrosine phosphatase
MNDFVNAAAQLRRNSPRIQAERCALFLCSGNYYRSRHAEIYFNWLAARRGAPWRAVSRGLALSAGNVGPVSVHTASRVAALSLGVDPGDRFPLAARGEDFEAADHIVAVKGGEHRAMIAAAFPERISEVEFWEVHDLDCACPNAALPELEGKVEELLERLIAARVLPMPSE